MPSLGAYFQDDFASAVEAAAIVSPEKKVGPWITEACRQRLEREGKLPPNPMAEVLAKVEELGIEESADVLKRALRKKERSAA